MRYAYYREARPLHSTLDARAFIRRRAARRTNATTRAMAEDDDWRARIDRTAAVQELCVRDATTRMDGSIMNLFDG